MRFMLLILAKDYKSPLPDATSTTHQTAKMMQYNESLRKAGVLLAVDGLHPPTSGARASFNAGKPTVTDGPLAESKEVVGGYWLIEVHSKAEAIEWAKRCPAQPSETLEIRQVHEHCPTAKNASTTNGT